MSEVACTIFSTLALLLIVAGIAICMSWAAVDYDTRHRVAAALVAYGVATPVSGGLRPTLADVRGTLEDYYDDNSHSWLVGNSAYWLGGSLIAVGVILLVLIMVWCWWAWSRTSARRTRVVERRSPRKVTSSKRRSPARR